MTVPSSQPISLTSRKIVKQCIHHSDGDTDVIVTAYGDAGDRRKVALQEALNVSLAVWWYWLQATMNIHNNRIGENVGDFGLVLYLELEYLFWKTFRINMRVCVKSLAITNESVKKLYYVMVSLIQLFVMIHICNMFAIKEDTESNVNLKCVKILFKHLF